MKNLREYSKIGSSKHHPDFEFVKPGKENLFIVRMGDAGKVYSDKDEYGHYTEVEGGHHFIYCYEEETIERMKKIERLLVASSYSDSTIRNCHRSVVRRIYMQSYPERDHNLTTYPE